MKILPCIAVLASPGACTGGTRLCSTFDLPQADAWDTVGAIGEAATFRNAAGEHRTLPLLSREDNEPLRGLRPVRVG